MSTSSSSNSTLEASVGDVVRNEERLQALRRYDILDTDPEPAFDRITRLAAHLLEAPTSIINFVDADRQWFKSTVGLEDDQTGLDVSFCVYTVEEGEVFVVEDLAEDERFADNPYVTDHGVRFYAGAPLITPDDRRLGTLCVLDTEPRSPSEETLARLADLAAMVVDELELRREQAEHEQSRELLRQSQQLADVGGSAYDPQTGELVWTDQTYDIFGLSPDTEVDLDTAVDFYTPESRSVIEPEVDRLLEEGGAYDLELDAVTADGERRRVRTIAEAQRDNGETTQIVGTVQDVTEQHRNRRLQEMQSAFFEWIATGAPINAVLDEIARFTEEELPGAAVSILRLDDNRLYHASGPSLPEDYIDAIDGVEIGPDVGTCGAAAYREQEVVTEDIREDARWDDFRAAAEQADFRSCASQVIRGSDGTIFGTFAIYRDEPGHPNPDEQPLVQRMSHVASVALEREQHERALRESKERWRRLVDKHPGPIHVSVEGEFVYANEAAAKVHGVESPDDLVGRDLRAFAHPEEEHRLEDRSRIVYEEREEAELVELRVRRADGTDRIALVRSVPIQYEGEAAAQTMMWDVTERREAERELRRSEKKFRTIVENAQPMTFMVDRDGTILLSEGEDLQSLDLEPGETVGESVYDRYADNPGVISAIERALDGEYVDEEIQVDDLFFDTWYSPFYDEEGEVAGVIGMAADITEERQTQRELREQKEMLQTIFDNVPVMFVQGELVQGDGENVNLVNRHFEEVTGWTAEEMRDGPAILDEFYPDPDVREEARSAIEEAPDEWRDFQLRAKDGSVVDTSWRGLYLSDGTFLGIGLDITERKERERELRDSNQRLRLALEAANAGSFEYDLATDRVLWDERSLDLYGLDLDPEPHDANQLGEIVLEEDLDQMESVFDRAVERGEDRYDVSYRIRRADDGELRHIRSHGLVLRDEDGTPDRVVGVNQDVTEQKERQKQLRLLETAVEQSPATVLITEADRLDEPGPRAVYANPAFKEMTGYDPDEIIGRSPRMLQGPDTDRAALKRIRTALENDEPVREVVRNYTKDGVPYWNELYVAPVRNEEGAVTHYVSIQQDVTERKRRKEVLERQNDLFTKAQDIADVGAWEYDVQDEQIILTDEAYRIHGLSPGSDMTPERSHELYHPKDRPAAEEAFRRAVRDGEPYDLEARLITEAGEERWIRTRGQPQLEDGDVVRVRGVIQDVTERVRRRNELKEAKEAAEEADRIKSALLSNMNHEFRTPLTSIISFSKILSTEPELAEKFADRILGGGKRLLHTLNTVMDFAELEATSVSATPKHVDVGSLAQSVISEFSYLADRKGLSVEVEEPGGAVTVFQDEKKMERILSHLVHNALKFTEEGRVTVTATRDAETVTLRVADTGVGIDPEFLPQVFDQFAQASSGNDRMHEGNGLGLTIVERMVDRMEGDVSIESTPGEGTEVTVRLPILDRSGEGGEPSVDFGA